MTSRLIKAGCVGFIMMLASCSALRAQSIAVKSNALYLLAGGTFNAAVEAKTGDNTTFQLGGSYNPWTFPGDKKMRFWLVEPEAKWWFCEPYEGHFVGTHAHGAQFFGGFRTQRYDGYMVGAGLTYGYDWILSTHWNLELEAGFGYEYLWYKQSDRIPCEKCAKNQHDHYVGPTKAALSLVYLF